MTQTQLQSSVPADATVTTADFVIGIPTYNNADSVAHVTVQFDDHSTSVAAGHAD